MAVSPIQVSHWQREHDNPDQPTRTNVGLFRPTSLDELVDICKTRTPAQRLKVVGSHWALSDAALSDDLFVETHDPELPSNGLSGFLHADLREIASTELFAHLLANPPRAREDDVTADPCLEGGNLEPFYVLVRGGTRIYEAYRDLDVEDAPANSLAADLNSKMAQIGHPPAFNGPWAFETLGGAGGQTVVGAAITGTHGGDYLQRPVADSIAAIHIVVDGGAQYWIEPQRENQPLIADERKLVEKYGAISPIQLIRSDELFNAAIVSVGRMGAIYSIVLRVVRQYCLFEHRVLDEWSPIKTRLNDTLASPGTLPFSLPYFPDLASEQSWRQTYPDFNEQRSRFLQIVINVCPHKDSLHRCGITQRWFVRGDSPLTRDAAGAKRGRRERGTASTAGASYPYSPDPQQAGNGTGTFLSRSCAQANFVVGILETLVEEVERTVRDNAVPAAGIIAAALAVGAGPIALTAAAVICAALVTIIAVATALKTVFDNHHDVRLGEVLDQVQKGTLGNSALPEPFRIAAWRVIGLQIFEQLQSPQDLAAISYAVMDIHDYRDRSCNKNVDSTEIFFNADRPDIFTSYIDLILSFEPVQQAKGRGFVGYISLRFVQASAGLIAPARWRNTVVMEIAGLRDASGTTPFIDNAIAIARSPIFQAAFHWGQRNPLERHEVARIFDSAPKTGAYTKWRNALRNLTEDGRRDGFSSEFTRRSGLEP